MAQTFEQNFKFVLVFAYLHTVLYVCGQWLSMSQQGLNLTKRNSKCVYVCVNEI